MEPARTGPPSTLVWEAFEQAPAFIAVVREPAHIFEYHNESYRRLIGHRNVIGLAVREALPDIEGQGFYELLDRVRATGEPFIGQAVPITLQHTSGAAPEERYLDFVYHPLRAPDGSPSGILVQGVDVTDQVRTQRSLHATAERYRALFTSMDEGFCVIEVLFDAHGAPVDYRFVETNPAFEKHTGLQQAVGRTIREMVPEHDAHWFEIYGRVARTREAVRFQSDAEALHRSFDVYAFPLGPEDDACVAVLFNDVTEARQAEREIQALNATLEARVAERTLQVRRLATRLTVAEQEVRQRIAQVIHDDLQQQLYGLSLVLSLLAREPTGNEAEALATRASEMLQSSVQIARSLVSELSPTVLQSESVRDVLRGLAERKRDRLGLTVEVEVDGEILVSDVSLRILLYQVLREVLFNVAKHSGALQARVQAWQDGGEVVVRVQDDGQGFDREAVESDGTAGFGLFSVRERVALVGGRFEIDSAPGAGTRVTIRLPLDPA